MAPQTCREKGEGTAEVPRTQSGGKSLDDDAGYERGRPSAKHHHRRKRDGLAGVQYLPLHALRARVPRPRPGAATEGDVLELKTAKEGSARGTGNKAGSRWLPGQDEWGEAFDDCPGVEYMLVRPADLDAVYEKLMR